MLNPHPLLVLRRCPPAYVLVLDVALVEALVETVIQLLLNLLQLALKMLELDKMEVERMVIRVYLCYIWNY
jgi:hypothetical protein